jgi:hypothetical protein
MNRVDMAVQEFVGVEESVNKVLICVDDEAG